MIGKDGALLWGEEDIMRGESNVPDALKFCSMLGPGDVGIITDTASFFSDDVYKILTFPSF